MKLSFNIGDIFQKLQKNVSIVFGVAVIAVMLMEALVIKHSIDTVLQVKNQVPNFQARIVRVNLPNYTKIETQINNSGEYRPEPLGIESPFATTPVKK